MKRQFQIIRLTAKVLLVLAVIVLVTGFLTAKPGLLDSAGFSTYRFIHSTLMPLLFVPVLFVHAGTGILLMLSRSKRFNTAGVRRAALGAWTLVGLVVVGLYLVEPEPAAVAELALVAQGGADPTPERSDGGKGGAGGADGGGGHGAAGAAGAAGGSAGPASTTEAGATAAPSGEGQRSPAVRPSSGAGTPPARGGAQSRAPGSATAKQLTGPQLIQQRCTVCHGLDVIVAKKRTTAEWSALVGTMIGYGAQLSPAERSLVMRYLPRKPTTPQK